MAKDNGGVPFAGNQLARLVRDSATQVWDAGRGAYTRAESGSSRLVGGLLSMGGRLDREAKSRVFEVRSSASEALGRLEDAFVQRVARTLNALQIPTSRDVNELNRRVESLQKAVVALERRAAAQAAAARPAAAARGKRAAGKGAARVVKKAPARARKKAGT